MYGYLFWNKVSCILDRFGNRVSIILERYMSRVNLPDLVILETETESNIIPGSVLEYMDHITISAPATLAEVVEVHSCPDETGTFQNHQSGGADIALTAGKNTTILAVGSIGGLKLVAGGAAAADRTFKVRAFERTKEHASKW